MKNRKNRDKYAGIREFLRIGGIPDPTEDAVRKFQRTMYIRFGIFVLLILLLSVCVWWLGLRYLRAT
jgi:hypothetical protein